MNFESSLYILSASNIYDGVVRISGVGLMCHLFVLLSLWRHGRVAACRCESIARISGQHDLAIFRPVAIGLQQFNGVKYGDFC
jgi:hypothetical protein